MKITAEVIELVVGFILFVLAVYILVRVYAYAWFKSKAQVLEEKFFERKNKEKLNE